MQHHFQDRRSILGLHSAMICPSISKEMLRELILANFARNLLTLCILKICTLRTDPKVGRLINFLINMTNKFWLQRFQIVHLHEVSLNFTPILHILQTTPLLSCPSLCSYLTIQYNNVQTSAFKLDGTFSETAPTVSVSFCPPELVARGGSR